MAKIVDLTLTIANNMLGHKYMPRPVVLPHTRHEESIRLGQGTPDDPHSFASTYLCMIDHTATHVDALFHVNKDGQTIDEMPLELFMGKAVCLDFRHIPDLGIIDVRDMEEAEREAGVRVDGHIVLLCTGLHRRHWPNESVAHSNPGITYAATRWLAERGSRLHGVEGPSTDKPSDDRFENHRACRDFGISHCEWLINLEELIGVGEFQFQGLPLKIQGATASPVRALAFLDLVRSPT